MGKFWKVLSGIIVVIALAVIGVALYRMGYSEGAKDMFAQVNELISSGKMPSQIQSNIEGILGGISDFWSSIGKIWR